MTQRLKLSRAARLADVHTTTLKRWIRNGDVEGWQDKPGGLWYVSMESLEGLLCGKKPPATDRLTDARLAMLKELVSAKG